MVEWTKATKHEVVLLLQQQTLKQSQDVQAFLKWHKEMGNVDDSGEWSPEET